MDEQAFLEQLHETIRKYDLLCHPFYKAWSAGELTREDLRYYSAEYYHHVAAFPTYLSSFHSRLPDGDLRREVLHNLWEEELCGVAHSELWLDFASGMGNRREEVRDGKSAEKIRALISTFRRIAREGSAASVLASFYAYESQIPQIATVKAQGLRELYGADERTCGYFVLHETADVRHSGVWAEQMVQTLRRNPGLSDEALATAQEAAAALWNGLDGIEEHRKGLEH